MACRTSFLGALIVILSVVIVIQCKSIEYDEAASNSLYNNAHFTAPSCYQISGHKMVAIVNPSYLKCFLIEKSKISSNRFNSKYKFGKSNRKLKLSNDELKVLAGNEIFKTCRTFDTYLLQDVPYGLKISKKGRSRFRRSNGHYSGRVRGQTQSQYLSFGNGNTPGKAEAEATYGSSKAVVSGSNGIGSAQSQSSPGDCDECYPGKDSQLQSLYYGGPSKVRTEYRGPGDTSYGTSYPDSDTPQSQRQRPSGQGAQTVGGAVPSTNSQQYPPSYGTRPGQQIPYQTYGQTPPIQQGQQPGQYTQQPPSYLPGHPVQGQTTGQLPTTQGQTTGQFPNQPQSPYYTGAVSQGQPTGQSPGQQATYQPGVPSQGQPGGTYGLGEGQVLQAPSGQYPGQGYYSPQQAPGQYVRPSQVAQPYGTGSVSPGGDQRQQEPTTGSGTGIRQDGGGTWQGHSGNFDGQVSGTYSPSQGSEGRFSGVFSGKYSHDQYNYPPANLYAGYPGTQTQGGTGAGTPQTGVFYGRQTGQGPITGQTGVPSGQTIYSTGQTLYPQGQGGISGGPTSIPTSQTGFVSPTGQMGYPTGQTGYTTGQTGSPTGQTGFQQGQPSLPRGQTDATGAQGGIQQTRYPSGQTVPTGIAGFPVEQSGISSGQTGYPTWQTGISPGQTGISPEQTGYPAEQIGASAGQTGYPTGHTRITAGQAGYPTGHAGQAGYPVGQTDFTTGQAGYPTAQNGVTVGQAGYPTGQTGASTGQTGYPIGHTGSTVGQTGYPIGQTGTATGQAGVITGQAGYPGGQTGVSTGQAGYPRGQTGYPQGQSGYPPGQTGYQGSYVPTGQAGLPTGQGGRYPYEQEAQNVEVPSELSIPPTQDDQNADSQAQAEVQHTNATTEAKAQAQGFHSGGTSQSQVSGSYSGSGSFSALAGTIDGKRGAQTQVSGGKEGATSKAQGNGGAGLSQAQVQLLSETGDTVSNAQSSGLQHGSNTNVQAGSKGGLADAQATGPGSTSSQAQIGFTPHNEENDNDNQNTPFLGGGVASAQSGNFAGQTQSQLHGKFRFGIRYSGAAQAGSGSKDALAASRNQTGRSSIPNLFASFNPATFTSGSNSNNNAKQEPKGKVSDGQLGTTIEEKVVQRKTSRVHKQFDSIPTTTIKPPVTTTLKNPSTELPTSPHFYEKPDDYNDEEDYDYEEEIQDNPPAGTVISQSGRTQRQNIILDPLEDLDASVIQSKGDPDLPPGTVIQPGQSIPGTYGYRIPSGFRGKVTSVANDSNAAASGQNSQAQSVSLRPGTGKVIYKSPTYAVGFNSQLRSGGRVGIGTGYTYHPISYQLRSGDRPNFVSVTKSESGSKDLYTGVKKPSIYYTQSSTCGFFTNTCVIRGNQKICIPKPKTNPDGSPIIC